MLLSGSLKILMQVGIDDQLDVVELLNELEYKSVADVMELQMAGNSATLQERIKCGNSIRRILRRDQSV